MMMSFLAVYPEMGLDNFDIARLSFVSILSMSALMFLHVEMHKKETKHKFIFEARRKLTCIKDRNQRRKKLSQILRMLEQSGDNLMETADMNKDAVRNLMEQLTKDSGERFKDTTDNKQRKEKRSLQSSGEIDQDAHSKPDSAAGQRTDPKEVSSEKDMPLCSSMAQETHPKRETVQGGVWL